MDTYIILFGMEYDDINPTEQFTSRNPKIYKIDKSIQIRSDRFIFPEKGYTIVNVDRMNKEEYILCYKKYESGRFVSGIAIVDWTAKLKKQLDINKAFIDNVKFENPENIYLTGISIENNYAFFNLIKITEKCDIVCENKIQLCQAGNASEINHGIFKINENTFITFLKVYNNQFEEICVAITFDNRCNILEKIEIPKLDSEQQYENINNIIQIEPTVFLINGSLGPNNNSKAFSRLITIDGKTISVKYSKNANYTFVNYCALKNKNDEILIAGLQEKIHKEPFDIYIADYGKPKYPKSFIKEYKVSNILQLTNSLFATKQIQVSNEPVKSSEKKSDEQVYLTDDNNKIYEAFISKNNLMIKIIQIFQRNNSNYVLLGTIMNGPNQEPGIDGIMLIELTSEFKIVWRENIYSSERYHYEPLKCFENKNNELVVIANSNTAKTINDKLVYYLKIEILKIDNGEIISKNELNFSSNNQCFGAFKTKDNEISLTMLDYENINAKKYSLVRIDFSGNVLWKKKLVKAGNYEKSVINKNGNILLAGINLDKKTVCAAKYNYSGELEWYKEYSQPNFVIKDIFQTENGNYIIAGNEQTISYSKIALLILEANGNLIKYENSYPPFANKYCIVNGISKFDNENYLVLGSVDAKTQEKIFYMAVNEAGLMQYHKIEEKEKSYYSPNTMLIDSNKNLIVSGITGLIKTMLFTKMDTNESIFIRNFGDISSYIVNYQEKAKIRDLKRRGSSSESKTTEEDKKYHPSEIKKRERIRN